MRGVEEGPREADGMKICLPAPDLSTERLRLYARLGVEAVTVPHRVRTDYVARSPKPLVPPAGRGASGPQPPPPDVDELRRVTDRVRDFGLQPAATSLGLSAAIVTDGADRESDMDTFAEGLRAIGAAGIEVVTLNFTALRASEGYGSHHGGRGGAQQAVDKPHASRPGQRQEERRQHPDALLDRHGATESPLHLAEDLAPVRSRPELRPPHARALDPEHTVASPRQLPRDAVLARWVVEPRRPGVRYHDEVHELV